MSLEVVVMVSCSALAALVAFTQCPTAQDQANSLSGGEEV